MRRSIRWGFGTGREATFEALLNRGIQSTLGLFECRETQKIGSFWCEFTWGASGSLQASPSHASPIVALTVLQHRRAPRGTPAAASWSRPHARRQGDRTTRLRLRHRPERWDRASDCAHPPARQLHATPGCVRCASLVRRGRATAFRATRHRTIRRDATRHDSAQYLRRRHRRGVHRQGCRRGGNLEAGAPSRKKPEIGGSTRADAHV